MGEKKKHYDICIVSHGTPLSGPIDYYQKYLLTKGYSLFVISHPLDNYSERSTEIFKDRKIINEIKRKNIGIINLFLDFFLSIKFSLRNSFDTFIGANNFDTFVGIILRKVFRKKIRKIIYFAADFSEDRYKNKILNAIYYKIEYLTLRYSDQIVSNTKRAEKKRMEMGLEKGKSIVIPNGVHLENPNFSKKNIDRNKFIFVGSVTKEHGLYNLINAISASIKELAVIGQGDDWERVISLCKKKNINFSTYKNKSHEFVIDFLQKFNGFGLAPYNMNSKWTYYCSPLKVNEYIACGVPVVMSSIPEIALLVEEKGYGVVYNSFDEDLVTKIHDFDAINFQSKSEEFYAHYNYKKLYSKIDL